MTAPDLDALKAAHEAELAWEIRRHLASSKASGRGFWWYDNGKDGELPEALAAELVQAGWAKPDPGVLALIEEQAAEIERLKMSRDDQSLLDDLSEARATIARVEAVAQCRFTSVDAIRRALKGEGE